MRIRPAKWRQFSLRELFAFTSLACCGLAVAQAGTGAALAYAALGIPAACLLVSLKTEHAGWWWTGVAALFGAFHAGAVDQILLACLDVKDISNYRIGSDEWDNVFYMRRAVRPYSIVIASLMGIVVGYVIQRQVPPRSDKTIPAGAITIDEPGRE